LRKEYFVVLEGFDTQIHVLYFCPQLYKRATDGNLIALEGDEIGQLLVRAFCNGTVKRQLWYHPSDKLEIQPIIGKSTNIDLDTIIRNETIPKKPLSVPPRDHQPFLVDATLAIGNASRAPNERARIRALRPDSFSMFRGRFIHS
jgi:hypothetical protein